jgi:two-component system chemotaxis response regulator CheB
VVGIVLHIPAPFTKSLAARLESSSGWRAREARDGEAAEDGTILVAPAGHHMEFVGRKGNTVVRIRGATSLDKWVPSADSLFSSAATVFGPELVAVVLTGMGNDGTIGATDVSAAGGCVIAESSETAVISGMPEATACAVPKTTRLPLGQIGAELSGHFPLATLTRFHE